MKLKPFTTLLRESFESYRTSAGHLVAFQVLPTIVVFGLMFLVGALFIAGYVFAGVVMIVVGIILALIIGIACSIAMMQRIAHDRPTLALRASLEATRPFFFQYLLISILLGLAVMAGLILFIIPGIIIGVWLSFSYWALVLENARGTAALSASKNLVSGYWWPVFGRSVGLLLLYIILSGIVGYILTVLFGQNVSDFLGTILNIIVSPYLVVFSYHLYLDVKRVKRNPEAAPEVLPA